VRPAEVVAVPEPVAVAPSPPEVSPPPEVTPPPEPRPAPRPVAPATRTPAPPPPTAVAPQPPPVPPPQAPPPPATPAAPPQPPQQRVLAPQVSVDDERRIQTEAQRRIDGTERVVRQIESRRLADEQQQNLLTIQSFLVKAKEALTEKDVQRAV